ncbi:signal peptide peptidase SppA [Natronomonas salina]|uniref:signal peptide peptidase SppA n=1 Tax=Natronomonas salina TaxID=1710540 RepID=UPI0015B504F1|nr:signal peptide peptidase SppA [Natronomonas salina]
MNMLRTVGRIAIVTLGAALAAAVGWMLFVAFPTSTVELVGVLLVLAAAVLGLRVAGNVARSVFPGYNVAEVAVEGPITRDSGGGVPFSAPGTPGADDVVELVERADADGNAEALLLRLNTPGGAVVPSDDIRLAAEKFDGPTVAYATDVCASGGYWIASGCDELWAREGSIVGSIGVRGSRMTASDLLDKAGVEYEQFTAGEYKEAGVPFEDLDDDERAYLQGLIDDYYDQFVETVAEGRDMDDEIIRETEARVYLGEEADAIGLVDEIGTRDDVEERLEDLLEEPVETTELEPTTHIAERLRGGAERVAYAAGAGVAGQFTDADGEFRFRV